MLWFYTSIVDIVFVCFVCSVFFLKQKNAGWYRHFIWFLGLSFLVELAGYLCFFIYHTKNHFIFKFFMPVEAIFSFWAMAHIFKNLIRNTALLFWVVTGSFIACYTIEVLSIQFTEYSSISSDVLSFAVIILCLLYYYLFLKQETYTNLWQHADFWVLTGFFLFYFVITASNYFFKHVSGINQKSIIPLRFSILIVINLILYGCWTYAFLCRKRKTISASY